jgi:hypothetical protein
MLRTKEEKRWRSEAEDLRRTIPERVGFHVVERGDEGLFMVLYFMTLGRRPFL